MEFMGGEVLTSVGAGSLIFLGVYLSFDYWSAKVMGKLDGVRERTRRAYKDIFVDKSPEQITRQLSISGGIAAILPMVFMWPNVLLAIPVGVGLFFVGWSAPLFYIEKYKRPKRITDFSMQMVDALTLMGNGLKSGLNVSQTMKIVCDEMPAPISEEFARVLQENQLGATLEKAFENMNVRIPSEDVNMFVTSVNILRETGGNIAETFHTITNTIRERLKLQSKIKAMTAQGMSSAFIVGALPWGLGIMLYVADPKMMGPMFTTIPGWAILMVILLLESVGFFVIVKIVSIRV